MSESIILKASDYLYPSREESKKIYLEEPILETFGFPYANEMTQILSGDMNLTDIHRYQHLYWWDNCLANRNGNLSRTYLVALVNFNRGFPDELSSFNGRHYINRLQFDIYAETFYYFFSTVKDTIAQILNVYFDLNFAEDKVYFGKLVSKVPNVNVALALKNFEESTKLTTEYRNSFTHRFPINQNDYRPLLTAENNQTQYSSIIKQEVKSSNIKDNVKESFNSIAILLQQLKKEMSIEI